MKEANEKPVLYTILMGLYVLSVFSFGFAFWTYQRGYNDGIHDGWWRGVSGESMEGKLPSYPVQTSNGTTTLGCYKNITGETISNFSRLTPVPCSE